MNKTEEEIIDKIIERIEYRKRMNKSWLDMIGGNKKCSQFIKLQNCGLYKKEYTYLDYLDGRKNLIEIPNFCKYTGEKISKDRIKKTLSKFL